MLDKFRSWLIPLVYLSDNWISLIGVVLVTTCAVFWLFLLPVMLGGGPANAYLGILIFLILPGAFFLSLVLIPLGIFIERRRKGRSPAALLNGPPSFDFGRIEIRRLAGFIIATTAINIVIGSQLSYAAVNYMESVQFCGQTCHTVMQPEFMAHQNSAHSHVACVECHVGSGASWFVRSKVSGTRQLFALAFHTYSTPIPTPVHNLRPARDTCEGCHWAERSSGDRLHIISKFAEDANNTPSKTVLLMHIGGGNGKGIHGMHLGSGITIRYASDEQRQDIPWVSYQNGSNAPTVFKAGGFKQEKLGALKTRVMDCLDCHNRPSHTFQSPDRAVDEAMASGAISTALPFAHKESMTILKTAYPTGADAAAKIPAAFSKFYQQNYADVFSKNAAEVQRSAKAVLAIYNRNVFPAMKVTWGSYPNNLGHNDFPGCFRCHDDGHSSTSGVKITQDCGACHNLLANEEQSPKVLNDLGLAMSQPAAPHAPVN
jgi:hypothetical protein